MVLGTVGVGIGEVDAEVRVSSEAGVEVGACVDRVVTIGLFAVGGEGVSTQVATTTATTRIQRIRKGAVNVLPRILEVQLVRTVAAKC